MALWTPTPSVLIWLVEGYGDVELAEPAARELTRATEGCRGMIVFFDGLSFTGYEPSFRAILGLAGRQAIQDGHVKEVCVLTRSKIVAMGAAVVAMTAESKFDVFSNVKAFEKRMVRAGASIVLSGARATG